MIEEKANSKMPVQFEPARLDWMCGWLRFAAVWFAAVPVCSGSVRIRFCSHPVLFASDSHPVPGSSVVSVRVRAGSIHQFPAGFGSSL